MLKEPRLGRVKTRLGADIGMVDATWWFRHQAKNLLRRIRDPRWDLILGVAPDVEGMKSRIWSSHLPRIQQGRGNLGNRMGRIFHALPPGPVVIIGSDIPNIQKSHIVQSFTALGSHQAVFGPAFDGGYWLIGMKRVTALPSGLFDGVRWSTKYALADTRANILDLRVAEIETLRDVDTGSDLKLLS